MTEVQQSTTSATPTKAALSESALAFEIEFLAVKAFTQGTRRANALLNPLHLKVRSYSVLALAASGIEPTQRDLADFLLLDPSQIVALVDELESKRLVARVTDAADRRSKVVTATPAGVELFERASEVTREAEADSLEKLTPGEQATLRALLRKIVFDD